MTQKASSSVSFDIFSLVIYSNSQPLSSLLTASFSNSKRVSFVYSTRICCFVLILIVLKCCYILVRDNLLCHGICTHGLLISRRILLCHLVFAFLKAVNCGREEVHCGLHQWVVVARFLKEDSHLLSKMA